MNYSTAIKTLRREAKLSQMEMADELEVSFATINRWENGHHEPTIKAKKKLDSLLKKHNIQLTADDDPFLEALKHQNKYKLIRKALTDSSYKNHQQKHGLEVTEDNLTLATYGDAVLKLAFCEILFDEEKLSVEKSEYESDRSLVAHIGKRYRILDYMKLDSEDSNMPKDYSWKPNDRHEDNSHKRIATCIEAIIGAIYKQNKDIDEIIQIARNWKEYIDSHKSSNE